MTAIRKVRRLAATAAVLAGLGTVALGVRAAADRIERSAHGADPASVFNAPSPAPAVFLDGLAWVPDSAVTGRPMEPETRTVITDSYSRALAALDRSWRGDRSAPLAEYLSGPALEAASEAAEAPDRVAMTTRSFVQELRLDFYSDDGSVVGFSTAASRVERTLRTGSPTSSPTGDRVVVDESSWVVVMVLVDGNWRVVQLRTGATP